MAFLLTGCSQVSKEDYNNLKSESETLRTDNEVLQKEKDTLQSNYDKLNADYEKVKTELSNMANQSISTAVGDTQNELFAESIIQGIGLDYKYVGSMLYDGVAQINIFSEKEANEEMDYLSDLLSKGSINVATLMNSHGIETLYLKVVDKDKLPIFEYTYLFGDKNEVRISVSLDYLNE